MSLRPVAAHWFELVTIHQELARVMECLSRTGAVELESHSRASERLLFPGMDEALKAHRDLARRYQAYWPPAAGGERRSEHLSNTLKVAQARLAAWVHEADPIIAAIEHASREAADLERLRAALQSAGGNIPDIGLLAGAGPKLAVRLLALPAATLPREIPSLVLFKSWQTPQAGFALVVGRPPDIEEIETQLTGLKGRVVPIPNWLPAAPEKALAAVAERLAQVAQQRAELTARLEALSQRLDLAHALGDIALIEWLNEHAKDLRGSKRLAWVTGWTSDVGGTGLRRALEACGVRYILRLSEMPQGATAPMVLRNPGWARAFEVFARMLGTPGQHETDPSQILAVIASSIFGFMFGDVGQGALVLIAGLLFGRRIPLARMLVPGGIMAIVFGLLFGSVFCREDILPALWLRPLDQPITILIAAIVAGVVIISIGLLLDAMQAHWRGEALNWWGHRAGLLLAYAGLLLSPQWPQALVVVAAGASWFIFGAGLVTRTGRVAALVAAAAEFVEQVLRLLVNTVSFARIGAFALAHAGLSVAIVELAQASGHFGFWIVLAIGNLLVIALEGVVVSIQTTRLLLFEFFIRFLAGAGRAFKPLPPPVIALDAVQQPNLRATP